MVWSAIREAAEVNMYQAAEVAKTTLVKRSTLLKFNMFATIGSSLSFLSLSVNSPSYCILEDHFPTHPTHIPIAPTDQPSKQPTLPPTPEPTSEPTSEPTHSPTHCPSSHPSLSASSCSNNARCNALDLEGECCPSSEGAFLDCCGQGEITEASCSKNPMCAHLTGQCCPTEQGIFLACCNADRN